MTEIGNNVAHPMMTDAINRQINSRLEAGIQDSIPNEGDVLQLATLAELYKGTTAVERDSPEYAVPRMIYQQTAKNTTKYYQRACQLLNATETNYLGLTHEELKAAKELQALLGQGSANAPKLAQWLKTETQNENLRGVVRNLVTSQGPFNAGRAEDKVGWFQKPKRLGVAPALVAGGSNRREYREGGYGVAAADADEEEALV